MRLFCPIEQLSIEGEEACGGYEDTNQKGDQKWSPIQSVITQVINKIRRLQSGSLIC